MIDLSAAPACASSLPPEINMRFTAADLEAIRLGSERRCHDVGEVLFEEGDVRVDCRIVISDQLDVYRDNKGQETRVAWLEPGQFPGDVEMRTGQAVWASARTVEGGGVLHIPHDRFQRLLVVNSRLSDMFINAMVARRALARARGRSPITIHGQPYDREAFAFRTSMDKHGNPQVWLDVKADHALLHILATKGLARDDLPVVFRGARERWVRLSLAQLSEALGFDPPSDGACADVLVVGAGNSAGQGAMYLARTAKTGCVIYRGDNIRDTISECLVRRLEKTPNVGLHPACDIHVLKGCEEPLRKIEPNAPQRPEILGAPFVFWVIGAAPITEWLPDTLCKDQNGLVHTSSQMSPPQLMRAGWALERMRSAYEASWPRVYAGGDVRAASVKRAGSAVGEGPVMVQATRAVLANA